MIQLHIPSPTHSCASSVCSTTSNDLSDLSASDVDDCHSQCSYRGRTTARKWSAEEDQRLKEAVEKLGLHKWKEVADMVRTRDATKCMQRWVKGLSPGLVKGRWSEDEDRMLTSLVSAALAAPAPQGDGLPVIAWTHIAKSIPGRTSKQCRERWFNFLDPTLNKGPFSAEEDEFLLELYRRKGRHWAQIAREMVGRTENVVKVRCLALLRKEKESMTTASSASFSFPRAYNTQQQQTMATDSSSVGGSSYKRGRGEEQEDETDSVTKKTRIGSLLLSDLPSASPVSLTRCSSLSSISVSPTFSRDRSGHEESFFFPLGLRGEEIYVKEEASEDMRALLMDLFPESSQSQSSLACEQPPSLSGLCASSAAAAAPSPAPLVTPLPPSLTPLIGAQAHDLVPPFVYRPQATSPCSYVPLSVPVAPVVPPSPVPAYSLPLTVPVPVSAMSVPVPAPPQGYFDSQFEEALDFLCEGL